ncbi:tyrosine-type recombinase/integrase [Aristophania vespae]|uniref:tyrosine-type recombinase/integrase n=1 Tax=Aristophania vespae TaxID=2697033 RepID=UPI002351AA0C|nr:tyrosine-type recombinase/integrase [Aristophania vespae]UMM63123.1 Tyrosine recombinase XerC [Aristophania vespae]
MSLKLIKRPESPYWYVCGTVKGAFIRESTGTTSKKKAEEYKSNRENELWQESIYGPKSVITFSHALAAYLEAEERSETTKFYLSRLLDHFKNTKLINIGQIQIDEAYKKILRDGISASSATKIRGVLTPLRAVLEFASRRQWCDRPSFERPKVLKNKTVFLKPNEVIDLIQNASEHLRPLFIFLVSTGVRASEALELEWDKVDLKGHTATVWQKQGTERRVYLHPVIMNIFNEIQEKKGRVFRPNGKASGYYDNGRTSGGQFKKGWAGACMRANLPGRYSEWIPRGQKTSRKRFVPLYTPHDLRHTWATWHYCLHRDLLLLKEEGGWETITMVTRYAKKMSNEYETEIRDFLAGKFLAQNLPSNRKW